ncbi:MAG: hypothetical protein HYS07_04375 [Chlamydiae bacterium]|nr:hypothetical protein [Chlamydiota bacterium]MBI3277435.1 hypothetical protein [Chlamydiota bacterium]
MELVIDANILLACFKKEAFTRELLLDARLSLFAPEYLIFEVSKHLREDASLRRRIGLTIKEIDHLLILLTQNIKTVPYQSYQSYFSKALVLAPHDEDAPYLALALFLKISVWSNDKGLKNQTDVKVYSTTELAYWLRK